MPLPKFQVHDRVTSRFTGLPMQGIVIGVMEGGLFAKLSGYHPMSKLDWNRISPKWWNSYIYYIKPDAPIKHISMQELSKELNIPIEDEFITNYYNTIPEVEMIAYIEADLELVDAPTPIENPECP